MGKGAQGKSSASSGTRKKHAKKHAPPPEEPVPKTKKGKKDRGKKEPRQKIYIPPVKPAPVQPDPLETTGLAHSLPADLLIVLRSFNKKAEVTKIRALEELQVSWVDKCLKGEGEDEALQYTLVEMLPVWLHHVSALFLHPSRRVRALTASIHLSLLQISPVREQIFFFLRETASTSQVESLLGSWCVAAHDVDKAVATAAMRSWKETIGDQAGQFQLDRPSQASLVEFVQRTALDPAGIYAYLNPVQPSITPASSQPHSRKGSGRSTPVVLPRKDNPEQLLRSKLEDSDSESEQDRKARLRFGALGAIKWILESVEGVPESLLALFANPAFLTSLQPKQSVPWIDLESFGYGQPAVRKNMWALLLTLLSTRKGLLQDMATELSRAILRSAFIENDSNVQSSMWYPLLLFLKEFPNSWELEAKASHDDEEDDDDDDDDDDEGEAPKSAPTSSAAYQEFLQFLQLGCSGSPIQGYPTVVIILSTISVSIIAGSSPTPLDDLFSSFWAALDGRALSTLNRTALSTAFLSSLLECMVLVLKRVRSPQLLAKLLNTGESEVQVQAFSKALVLDQFEKMWQEIVGGKLKMIERILAKSLVKTMRDLADVDPVLSEAAWQKLSSSIFPASYTHPRLVSRLVKEMRDEVKGSVEWTGKLDLIIATLAEKALDGYVWGLDNPIDDDEQRKKYTQELQLLTDLLDTFKHGLFSASALFREQMDGLLEGRAYELLTASEVVFLAILGHRGPPSSASGEEAERGVEVVKAAWTSILGRLAQRGEEGPLKVLVDAVQRGRMPSYLKVYGPGSPQGALDQLVQEHIAKVASGKDGSGLRVEVLRGILIHREYFISSSAFFSLFEGLCTTLKGEIRKAFEDPFFKVISISDSEDSLDTDSIPWGVLESLTSLVLSTFKTTLTAGDSGLQLRGVDLVDGLVADAFLYAYLLPLCEATQDDEGQASFSLAGEIWAKWYAYVLKADEDAEKGKSRASKGLREVREKITGLVIGTKTRVSLHTVLTLLFGTSSSDCPSFFTAHPEFSTDTVMEFMPSAVELDRLLENLMPGIDVDSSMGVLDALVPPPTGYPYTTPLKISSTSAYAPTLGKTYGGLDIEGHDRYGYSAYARAVAAIVTVFARDRASAKCRDGVEMLRHLGVVEVCAWDAICLPPPLSTSTSTGEKTEAFGERAVSGFGGHAGGEGANREGGTEAMSLAGLITKIEQVSTYVLLVGGGDEPWKRYVLDSLALPATKPPVASSEPGQGLSAESIVLVGGVKKTMHALMNPLSNFALDVIGRAVQSEVDLRDAASSSGGVSKDQAKALKNAVVLRSRILRRVLERVFDDDTDPDSDEGGIGRRSEDVDVWVGYVRKVERAAPSTALTILSTIASLGLDSPRLDRLRNEFAASLLGVPPPQANTRGLEMLRALGSCAPSEDVDENVGDFDVRVTTITTVGGGVMSMKTRGSGARRSGSDVIFLPVQRGVNVVRACQQWVEGKSKPEGGSGSEEEESEDEDEDGPSEDLESAMLAVFIGLSPILQNVPGKHWDFMWDVVETVLENSTLEDETTLLGLSRALRFVRVMEDLVKTNKGLKTDWSKRRVGVLGNVRDLLLEEGGDNEEVVVSKTNSMPRSVCRELVLSIVQSLPGELIDQNTLGKMCHLVTDSSIEVQKMGYGMLRKAAEKRSEWIVIEVGVGGMGTQEGEEDATAIVDPSVAPPEPEHEEPVSSTSTAALVEPEPQPQPPVEERKVGRRKDGRRRKKRKEVEKAAGPSLLPEELIAIVKRDEEADLFGWMLGWMLVFDLFNDVSFKVKSMYIEQLRNLDLVGSRLLPTIIHLLRLDEGLNKAVKVETWAVDEFYVSYYEPVSAPALAAHLYYRALLSVPSLIHTWVLACKDRQLSHAITSLTSQHFSPLIIRAELAHLKSAEGMAELSGEGLTVKVVGGNSEVVATYAVDEHQLEIKLKIPPDWPLHKIEVRDEKRVGVDENRWRAWVLGVQQTIWTHNGRIVDGLSLFKKNVTLHFEGQVECAICYSIISVSDGSLPKKPCKTCRNRFHAGCLYKWFNTSHSSSCPLCRSNII